MGEILAVIYDFSGHEQRSQAASPVRLGFRAAGLGSPCGRPGRTVGYSLAFRAYPGPDCRYLQAFE